MRQRGRRIGFSRTIVIAGVAAAAALAAPRVAHARTTLVIVVGGRRYELALRPCRPHPDVATCYIRVRPIDFRAGAELGERGAGEWSVLGGRPRQRSTAAARSH